MADKKKETKKADKTKCGFENCPRLAEKESEFCIFHISAEEKERRDLWEKCMVQFYKLVEKGEGDFKGFVLRNIYLAGRVIEQEIDFEDAQFFGNSTFSLILRQDRTKFRNKISFRGVTFNENAYFYNAIFNDETDFSRTKYGEKTFFSNTIFLKKTDFRGICFTLADFTNVTFSDRVIFSPKNKDKINGIPTFTSAIFKGAYFEKGGSFDDCIMKEGYFENASIQNVSFRNVNLDNVCFAGAQMELTYLADSEWTAPPNRSKIEKFRDIFSVSDPRYVLKEELEAKKILKDKKEEKIKALQNAEGTYRRIKHSLQNEGEYEKASGFYIHEMKMKRKRYWHTMGLIAKWNFFWNWFYAISCGYSERPKRVVINALIIILFFSTIYYSFDAMGKDGEVDYKPSAYESIYFSVVTFTTLGYGDYSPKPHFQFQLLASLEAFIGAFTIALFVLVFGRKVMR